MVVGTVLSNVIPQLALKTGKIWTMNWSWNWGARCRIIVSWGVHIDWVLFDSYYIGCCSHCFCVRDDGSDQPSSLDTETPGVLRDESSLKDSLSGTTKTMWVGGGGNLWRGKLSRN